MTDSKKNQTATWELPIQNMLIRYYRKQLFCQKCDLMRRLMGWFYQGWRPAAPFSPVYRLGNHDLWKSESFLKLWECQLPWPHAYACHTASFTMTFPCSARTDLWQGVLWPHPFFKRIFPFNSVFDVLVCYWCGSSFQLLFVEKASLKVWSFFSSHKTLNTITQSQTATEFVKKNCYRGGEIDKVRGKKRLQIRFRPFVPHLTKRLSIDFIDESV